MEARRKRPSASMVVSFIALAVALSGTAWAAATIDTTDIKKAAITTGKLDNSAVTALKIANGNVKGNKLADGAVKTARIADLAVTAGKLANETITGAQVADDSLNDTKISDYEVIGGSYILADATAGADATAAREAAPEIPLFSKGQLNLYAKCYHDTGADQTFGVIYSRTTADGSIQQGLDDLPGGNASSDFLNVSTLEPDRELDQANATGNDANFNELDSSVASPDGTGLGIHTYIGAKNGALAGGEGLYGAGNKCLFGGTIGG